MNEINERMKREVEKKNERNNKLRDRLWDELKKTEKREYSEKI